MVVVVGVCWGSIDSRHETEGKGKTSLLARVESRSIFFKDMTATKAKLLFVAVSGAPLVADAFGFAPASGLSLARRASNSRGSISLRMSAEERKLTNEECELLGLPNGSTLVGEESAMMKTKLNVKVKNCSGPIMCNNDP